LGTGSNKQLGTGSNKHLGTGSNKQLGTGSNKQSLWTCFNYQFDAQFLYSVIHVLQNKGIVHQVGN
jgi:hypothetical protein